MDTPSSDPVAGGPGHDASGGAPSHAHEPTYWTPSYATTNGDGQPPAGGESPGHAGDQPSGHNHEQLPDPTSGVTGTAGNGVQTPTGGSGASPRRGEPVAPDDAAAAAPVPPPLVARVGMDAGPRQVDFPTLQDTLAPTGRLTGMAAMPGWQPRRRPSTARVFGPLAALATFLVFGAVAAHMAGMWGNASSDSGPVVVLPDGTQSQLADPAPADPGQGNPQNDNAQDGVPGVHVGDLAYQSRGLTCGRRAVSLLPQEHGTLSAHHQWCVLDVTVQPGLGEGAGVNGPDAGDAVLHDASGHHWAADATTTAADDATTAFGSWMQDAATFHYWFEVDAAARPVTVTFSHQGETSDAVDLV